MTNNPTAVVMAAVPLPISAEEMTRQQILANLRRLGGEVARPEALRYGDQWVVPKQFENDLLRAANFLVDFHNQQSAAQDYERIFRYRPYDVYHAAGVVLSEMFGTVGTAGLGATSAVIDIGFGKQAQVLTGSTRISQLEATISMHEKMDPEVGPVGKLIVKAPYRYGPEVDGFFIAVEEKLKKASIYRGKAITGADQPGFLDPKTVDPRKVVYTDMVLEQLKANIWSVIEHAKARRKAGLPLKRSVLLYGPYGTGKSLAASLTLRKAIENKWTFIQVRPGDKLKRAMETAKLYAPAVVFFEDIDGVAEKGDPGAVSELLDAFDGIGNKGAEIVMVLTTNFVERIPPGMLRPGRMDAVISIGAMDRKGVEQLIKVTVPEDKLMEMDYDEVFEAYEGFMPAFAVEATQRAYGYAIARNGGDAAFLTTPDFVAAARGMRDHLAIMNNAKEGKRTPDVDIALRNLVRDSSHGVALVDAVQFEQPVPRVDYRLMNEEPRSGS